MKSRKQWKPAMMQIPIVANLTLVYAISSVVAYLSVGWPHHPPSQPCQLGEWIISLGCPRVEKTRNQEGWQL